MAKRALTYALLIMSIPVVVGGCTEFFGTISGRIQTNQDAIAYIHQKYNIPLEDLKADMPSFRYGMNRYFTRVHDVKNKKVYELTVRPMPDNHVPVVEESPFNPQEAASN
ncbi:hypothetical protein [Brevibacillus brevis]|uniref:hypothetical protein n=1 Tax=Brevibacillus brevis TaxID=1393 RepID=UPI000E39445A|nr:hypothetical protein [Brevibacillus brevis]RED23084.1 hypothetical protein DES34_11558 [Brevibacillus brevis]GEC89656.1 hypothetical protein BBR01nite_19870 [Brevibacillus brevis]VEF87466.1 Uncharacterised protein [Brevibacillus brevis]